MSDCVDPPHPAAATANTMRAPHTILRLVDSIECDVVMPTAKRNGRTRT
jgi:hypothetical protein